MSDRIVAGLEGALSHAKEHGRNVEPFSTPTSQEVRELRNALRLSQEQFAERYEIDLGELRKLEEQ